MGNDTIGVVAGVVGVRKVVNAAITPAGAGNLIPAILTRGVELIARGRRGATLTVGLL